MSLLKNFTNILPDNIKTAIKSSQEAFSDAVDIGAEFVNDQISKNKKEDRFSLKFLGKHIGTYEDCDCDDIEILYYWGFVPIKAIPNFPLWSNLSINLETGNVEALDQNNIVLYNSDLLTFLKEFDK